LKIGNGRDGNRNIGKKRNRSDCWEEKGDGIEEKSIVYNII
jgi:hypothetical protein